MGYIMHSCPLASSLPTLRYITVIRHMPYPVITDPTLPEVRGHDLGTLVPSYMHRPDSLQVFAFGLNQNYHRVIMA